MLMMAMRRRRKRRRRRSLETSGARARGKRVPPPQEGPSQSARRARVPRLVDEPAPQGDVVPRRGRVGEASFDYAQQLKLGWLLRSAMRVQAVLSEWGEGPDTEP